MNAQCAGIDFKSDLKVSKACPPAQVKFTASGFPSGSSFSWDFGSGSVSGRDTIYKIFTTAAKYTVTLTVTLSGGSTCTVTKKDMFEILPAPIPTVTCSPSKYLCNGQRVITFTDSTPNSVKRDWVIDGVSYLDTTASIKDSFTSIGFKSVALRVTNSYGCVSIFSDNKFVTVSDPASVYFCADIIQNTSNFKASYKPSVSLSGRTISHYNWSFPGGSPSSDTTSSPPSIFYSSATSKNDATLSITTSDGCVYKTTYKDFVEPSIKVNPDSACINSPFHITNTAKGANKSYFTWLLNNGTVNNTNDTAWFTQPGNQSLTLTWIYSGNGCTNTIKSPSCLKVIGTKADFSSPKRLLCTINDTVNLQWNSFSSGGGTPSYKWEFYDTLGKLISFTSIGSSNTPKLSAFLPKAGVFDVKLTITTTSGCVDTARRDAYIVIRKPKADFIADSPTVCLGKSIKLSNLTTPPDDKKNPYTYGWTIEDVDSPALTVTSTTKNLTFTATHPARYNVILTVSTNSGCADTIRKFAYLTVNGFVGKLIPRGVFLGCPPLKVHFSFKIVERYPDTITNIPKLTWSSKPTAGTTFSNQSDTGADVALSSGGCFNIIATMLDSQHCSKDVTTSLCPGVKAKLTVSANGCMGTPTKIFNASTNNPTHYKWTVVPASGASFTPSDTDQSPSIIYTKDTSYTIRLVVSKTYSNGICTDTADTFIQQLAVGHLSFKVTSGDTAYCAPAAVKFLNTSTDVKTFTWYFGDGDSFLNTRSDPPSVGHLYFKNNPKGYNITLIGMDTIGCKLVINQKSFLHIIGPAPGFQLSAHVACDSIFVKFKDTSQNIKKFVMNYDDGSAQDTVQIHNHFYKLSSNTLDSQFFFPTMVALDASNCKAFYKDSVKLYRAAVPDFKATITAGCAPFNASFTNLSLSARKYYWDFNSDGIIDDSTKSPSFIYTTPGTYKVTLTVKNAGGCAETVSKSNYITVLPVPKANLKLSSHHICGSELIRFSNFSTNIDNYSIAYGDGTKDSNVIKAHVYTFKGGLGVDSSQLVCIFKVYDSVGCSAIQQDTIKLYRKPNAGFTVSATKGCEPLSINYKDTTSGGFRQLWDFNNDGNIDDTTLNPTRILKSGWYSVKLIVIGVAGCSDTSLKTNLINIYPKPLAKFSVSDTLICPKQTVNFTDKSIVKGGISNYYWKFNESAVSNDVDTSAAPSFTFLSPGFHSIEEIVGTINGCKDTSVFNFIHVKDSMPPSISKILYVSVLDSNRIRVVWQKSKLQYFGNYNLTRDSVSYFEGVKSDTIFTDSLIGTNKINTNSNSYCYSLASSSDCNKQSIDPQSHCTILLHAKANNGISILLNWTPYTGWYDLAGYKIYRSTDGGVFTFLTDVAAGINQYLDNDLCAHKYTYYVTAIRQSANYLSLSNMASATPPYVYNTTPIYLNSATVTETNSVKVLWEKSQQLNSSQYYIDRFDSKMGWTYRYFTTGDTFMLDSKVNVNIESYIYRVRNEDKCGNISPNSNVGKTILLNNFIKDDKIALYWNNYTQWTNGIKNTLVQLKYQNNIFQTIASVNGTDTSFIFNDIKPESDTAYCFRVISYANAATDSSVSNISCAILPSRSFVPNAFTPNHDGLNDTWSPINMFITDNTDNLNAYSLKIFDRWGEKVFEANKLSSSWDGTMNGIKLPVGVYIYIMRAQGLDGRSYYYKGNIMLLR